MSTIERGTIERGTAYRGNLEPNTSEPPIEALRCFVAAAGTANFRSAAAHVHLTPSAFSARIKQLESIVGDALFHRTTRKVSLSASGVQLLPRAREALAAVQRCGQIAQAALRSELVVGTRHELGLSWLLPAGPALEKSGIRMHLYFGSGADLLLRVAGRDIDCAITSSLIRDPRLTTLIIHHEKYLLVAAPRLLAKRLPATSAALAKHELIDISPDLPLFRYWLDAAPGRSSVFAGVRYMGTIAAIRALVLRGAGVAVLPEYFVSRDLASGKLVRLFPRAKLNADAFRLVFRADDLRRSSFETMAARLRRQPLK